MNTSPGMPMRFAIHPLKISDDLLDETHVMGGSKAKFFLGWGLRRDDPFEMMQALVEHALHMPLTRIVPMPPWGDRLLFKGPILSPNDATSAVLTVWQMAPRSTEAMLVTSYPA